MRSAEAEARPVMRTIGVVRAAMELFSSTPRGEARTGVMTNARVHVNGIPSDRLSARQEPSEGPPPPPVLRGGQLAGRSTSHRLAHARIPTYNRTTWSAWRKGYARSWTALLGSASRAQCAQQ
jgi:hypothetical protein